MFVVREVTTVPATGIETGIEIETCAMTAAGRSG